jgi:hypothetical protein
MESAVAEVIDSDTVAAALAAAAHSCLRDALAAGADRTAALHLLAADGLITFACEAAADHDGAALDALARANTPLRLAHMVDEQDAS